MNATAVPVSERALLSRINRTLNKEDKVIKVAREGTRLHINFGRFYIVDWRRNTVASKHVDLEKLAKKIDCLSAWERLVED